MRRRCCAGETRVNPGSRGGRARIGLKSYTCDDLVIASPDSLANLARRQAETPLTALSRSQGSQLSGCGLPGDDQLAALALVEGGLPIDRAFPLRSRGGLNVVVGEHLPANEVRNLLYGSNGRSNTNGTLFLRAV